MQLNKTFSFRSFGGQEPKSSEVLSEVEGLYDAIQSDLVFTGQPGRRSTRGRIVANPADTKPNSKRASEITDDSLLPPGQTGFTSNEGGVYVIRSNGRKAFYQAERPSQGAEGDVWYDTDDDFKLYLFTDGEWVAVFENVPELAPTLLDSRAYLSELNRQVDVLLASRQVTEANILHVQRTSFSATEAVAYDLTVLNAQVNDPSTGLPASHARITTEATARASADGSAIASIVTALTAGSGGATVTSGNVIVGATYKITSVGSGIIVTNIGAPNNNLNTTFVATGTTPAAWNGGSLQETRLASIETWGIARVSADGSLAAEYVLNVTTGGAAGRRVAGFRITNLGGAGGGTDFIVQTDKFTICDTSGNIPTVPFEVTGGVVYIKEAVIKEVTAGKITAGTINATIEMTAATITSGFIRSSASTTFAATTGFYLGVDSGTPKFRIGNPAGSKLSWDGTTLDISSTSATIAGGSIVIGTGNNKLNFSSSGAVFGDETGNNGKFMSDTNGFGLYLRSSSTIKSFFCYSSGTNIVTLDMGSTGSFVTGTCSAQLCRANSSADSDNSDTSLYTYGGAYISGKFRAVGVGYFNTTLNVYGVFYAHSNAEVSGYFSCDGVIYGYNGSATGVAFAPRQDDVDSGMYSDEANKVKFAAGGQQIFRIVNSGQLFILETGTTLRLGNSTSTITTETLNKYITAQDSAGNTIKLAIVV